LPVIQRQLVNSYVSTTSVYLLGIDTEEIIGTIAPVALRCGSSAPVSSSERETDPFALDRESYTGGC
jgi:hypothetical protein